MQKHTSYLLILAILLGGLIIKGCGQSAPPPPSVPPDFTWTEVTTAAAFSPRSSHSSVVSDNKMWVIGGATTGFVRTNEVWSSSDGQTWNLVTAEAAFPSIYNHASVVFNNKIWMIGGGTHIVTNEVWSSADGSNWTQATAEAAFPARDGHTALVFNNEIWVIGGGQPYWADVWHSSDGVYWTAATTNAAFGQRYDHSSAVFDNKMWVIGGRGDSTIFDDAWYSSDGSSWARTGTISALGILPSSSEASRMNHTSVVYEISGNPALLIITGGYNSWNGGNNYFNDLKYSVNGSSWTSAEVTAAYSPRMEHSSVVFNNKIWVIGGRNGSTYMNDVWSSPLP